MPKLRPIHYIVGGLGVAAAGVPLLMERDVSSEEARRVAAKKNVRVTFVSGGRGRFGRYLPDERRIILGRFGNGYNFTALAHELGHAEADDVYAKRIPKIWDVLYYTVGRRLYRLGPIAAGMVTSRRKKALLLAGAMPEMLNEAHASLRGARILREEGKLTKKRMAGLLVPLMDRTGGVLIGYGVGLGVRGAVRRVRGHVRTHNGNQINVSSYFRRIRVRR